MRVASTASEAVTRVFARAGWGVLSATGPDRAKWLQGLVTCEVLGLEPGQGRWGLLLTRTGKIVSELMLVAAPDRLWIATPELARQAVFDALDSMLIMEDAELLDESARYACLSVHGPGAAKCVADVPAPPPKVSGGLDWLSPGDQWLIAGREFVPELTRALAERAELAERERWLSLRLEYATPEWGTDFGPDDNPHQAGLDQRCVAWSKGCYLGQEVVFMQGMRGKVRRKLTSFVLDAPEPCAQGTPVTDASTGAVLGAVTSNALSPTLGQVVGLAMLSGALTLGQRVGCAGHTAVLVECPLAMQPGSPD